MLRLWNWKREGKMSDDTKVVVGVIVGAPVLYFLLVCIMSL